MMPLGYWLVFRKVFDGILPAKDPEVQYISRRIYHCLRGSRDYWRAELPLPVVAQKDMRDLEF